MKIKELRELVEYMNEVLGTPKEPYKKLQRDDGTIILEAQVGCYYLAQAYGGHQIQRMENNGGGCSCPLGYGYVSKRELGDKIHDFLRGVTVGKGN